MQFRQFSSRQNSLILPFVIALLLAAMGGVSRSVARLCFNFWPLWCCAWCFFIMMSKWYQDDKHQLQGFWVGAVPLSRLGNVRAYLYACEFACMGWDFESTLCAVSLIWRQHGGISVFLLPIQGCFGSTLQGGKRGKHSGAFPWARALRVGTYVIQWTLVTWTIRKQDTCHITLTMGELRYTLK